MRQGVTGAFRFLFIAAITIKTCNSCKEAAEERGLNPSGISHVCRGKNKTSRKNRFRYAEDCQEDKRKDKTLDFPGKIKGFSMEGLCKKDAKGA